VIAKENLLRRYFGRHESRGVQSSATRAYSASGQAGTSSQPATIIGRLERTQLEKPLSDGPERQRSVEIILAIYKSAETGRVVQLPLKGDPVLKARKTGK
jgi:hypothetical protein